MACLVACFGCFKGLNIQQQRRTANFLDAVREGNEETAAAALNTNPEIVKSLQLLNKKNALHIAVEEGRLMVLAAVLEALICQESEHTNTGEDSAKDILNGQDAGGRTPLFIACAYGHSDCARFLMSNGADRNIADVHGNVPLHMAALRGHIGIIFMLLSDVSIAEATQPPSSVHVTNAAGITPLHMAVWGRHSGAVQVLLQHGADINAKTVQDLPEQGSRSWPACVAGTTSLHIAAARGHVEISKIFLKTYYECVLEPQALRRDRNLPPSTESTMMDPRLQTNSLGKMPYQIARHMGLLPLSMLLRPTVSLALLFNEQERNVGRIYGPSSLKTLATEALNRNLAVVLHDLDKAGPPATGPPLSPALKSSMQANKASMRYRSRPSALLMPAPPASLLPTVPPPLAPSGAAAPDADSAAAPLSSPNPPSPSLQSPRTPNLQAGRRTALQRPAEVEVLPEVLVLLPGMVSNGTASQLSQLPPASAAPAIRQMTAVVLTTGTPDEAVMEMLESTEGGPDSSQQPQVDAPLTPAPIESSRNADSCPAGAAGEPQEGSGQGGLQQRCPPGASSSSAGAVAAELPARDPPGNSGGSFTSGASVPDQQPSSSCPTGNANASSGRTSQAEGGSARALRVQPQQGYQDQEERLLIEPSSVDLSSGSGSLELEEARAAASMNRMLDASSTSQASAGYTKDPLGKECKGAAQAPSPTSRVVDTFDVSSMDDECGVCLENTAAISVQPCHHLICGACALKICSVQPQKQSLCPFCRSLIHGFKHASCYA